MNRKEHPRIPPSTPAIQSQKTRRGPDREVVAAAALDLLAASPELLVTFLDGTGLRVDAMRERAQDGTLTAALLHHLLENERLLVEVSRQLGQPPETVAAAAAGPLR